MNKPFKAVIVDDEPLARADLKALLKQFENVVIAGEAQSVPEARKLLTECTPDVVFLDIQMPGESGFDLLNMIPPDVNIIFVTAYDKYAIRAFEVNAQDYLLKPVNEERLAVSLERLTSKDNAKPNVPRPLKIDDCIFLKMRDSYNFLSVSKIIQISAADDYTEVFTESGQSVLVHKTMKEWESRLPQKVFCRIHRSTIINVLKVLKIEPWKHHSSLVYLKGMRNPAVMSRRYWSHIKEWLG